ncbi:AI-2E family transporter [Zongyangia hominis]|uniref:AI-2E family transporter n=1 Tax=Zongyangia hominis TaxID=2763677 RepID=A0A926EF75_9FIRM|nr:AI-2E family transporter [Zongyangia hominis]MBC8570597.1 AI-2E family transporter [Zongyangia hominis]
MKFHWDRRYTSRTISNILVLAAGVAIFLIFWNMGSIFSGLRRILSLLTPFLFGFAIAYLLNTPMNFFERLYGRMLERDKPRKKAKRTLAVITTYLVALIVLVALFSFILPQLVNSVYLLARNIPYYVSQLTTFVNKILQEQPEIYDAVSKFMISGEEIMTKALELANIALPKVLDFSMSLGSGVANFFLGIVVSFYLLMSKEKFCAQIKKVMYAFLPEGFVDGAINLARHSHQIFNGFITGKVLDGCIVGSLCFLFLTLFRWPYPILVAVIMGVCSLIPFFGAIIGAVISTLIILMVNPIQAIWFVIFIVVLQQIDGNIIDPKISGSKTGLPAFWALLAIIVAGGEFGFLGMLLGIPLFAVIYSIVRGLTEKRLEKRGLPWRTAEYEAEPQQIHLGSGKKVQMPFMRKGKYGNNEVYPPPKKIEDDAPKPPRSEPYPAPWEDQPDGEDKRK